MADTLIDLLSELQELTAKLEQIGFGSDSESVTHNGVTRASVAKQIKDSYSEIQAMVDGQIPYTTLALAQAAGEPPLDGNGNHRLYRVVGDGNSDSNGLYYWDGSTLIKSPYDDQQRFSNNLLEVEESTAQEATNPNAFTRTQLSFEEMPSNLASAPIERDMHAGVPALKARTNGSGGGTCYWRFPVSALGGATTFSASIVCALSDAGSNGEVVITQRDASFATLETNSVIDGVTGEVTRPTKYRILNQPLNPDAAYLDLRINWTDYADYNRVSYWRSMMIAAGSAERFRGPDVAGDALSTAKTAETLAENAMPEAIGTLDFVDPNRVLDLTLDDDYSGQSKAVESDGTPTLSFPDGFSGGSGRINVDRKKIRSNSVVAGASVYYAENTGARFLLLQFDESGAEIRDEGDGNGDYRHEFDVGVISDGDKTDYKVSKSISPNCSKLVLNWLSNGSGIRIGRPFIREKTLRYTSAQFVHASSRPFFIDPAGSDSDSGRENAPLASIHAAVARGAHKIIVQDGEYDPWQLELNGSWIKNGGVDVLSARLARPFTRSGIELTGFVATPGRTDVYQASLTTAPAMWNAQSAAGFLFVKSQPFGLITNDRRHPLHSGRSHIAPHYILKPSQSIDELEAVTEPSWFWNGSDTVYVRSIPDADPLVMTVVVPTSNLVYGFGNGQQVTMSGIGYEFAGVMLDNCDKYSLERMWVFGAPVDGFSLDKCSGADRYCQVVASSNDNWNAHNVTLSPGRQDGYASIDSHSHSVEPYSAWAFDDGRSIHECSKGSVHGGLFEFCGSSGIAPASGAEEIIDGAIIRSCGWELGPSEQQGGLAVMNPVIDDGTGTTCVARNVRIEDMHNGFYASGLGGVFNLYDTRTRNCTNAVTASQEYSVINAYNHHDSGSQNMSAGAGTVVFHD